MNWFNEWVLNNKELITIYSAVFQTLGVITVPIVIVFWSRKEQIRKELAEKDNTEINSISNFRNQNLTPFFKKCTDDCLSIEQKRKFLKYIAQYFDYLSFFDLQEEYTKIISDLNKGIQALAFILYRLDDTQLDLVFDIYNDISNRLIFLLKSEQWNHIMKNNLYKLGYEFKIHNEIGNADLNYMYTNALMEHLSKEQAITNDKALSIIREDGRISLDRLLEDNQYVDIEHMIAHINILSDEQLKISLLELINKTLEKK